MQREQADPRLLLAGDVAVEAAEQLVPAADGEERRAGLDLVAQRVRFAGEIVRDERLLAVLATTDVEEVDLAGRDLVVHADGAHLELVPARSRALRENGDVAAVRVDVEVIRIEVADADLHAAVSQ